MNLTAPPRSKGGESILRRLSRDYAHVLPGLPIAVFSFGLLIAMTAASVVTMVFWLGALLLPLTLVVASGFAELDRNRLRLWGAAVAPVKYRPAGPGMTGKLRLAVDPRRWLDLVFEMLIAFPLRLITFTVAAVWTLGGLAEISYFFWSIFLPDERSVIQLLELTNSSLVPESSTAQYLVDAGAHFLLGAVLLLTLPPVIRGLAGLDAMLTTALLGDGGRGELFGHRPEPLERTDARPGHSASFSGAAWAWIGAGFAAVVLLAVSWPLISVLYGVNVAVAMVLVVAHCAAVVLTLRWVWPGLALSLAAAGGLMIATAPAGSGLWPWPVPALITQCAVLTVAVLARPWYCAASAWCGGALLTLIALFTLVEDIPSGSLSNSIVFTAISAGVVGVGVLLRLWILNVGRLEAAERTSAEQDRRRKELQERNRIARELHDVVAHSMSVISVQASTAQYRIEGLNGAARREFEEIAGSSRQALSEMRMLLTTLRAEDEVPTAPEPGLEDIEELIQTTRSSGTRIRYRGLAAAENAVLPAAATPAAALAAYRIVQEALSNALRHAPGAEVEVELRAEEAGPIRRLSISVTNGPSPEEQVESAPGAGLGLSGIRERAAAVGGSAEAGPTEDGGFAVQARLPL